MVFKILPLRGWSYEAKSWTLAGVNLIPCIAFAAIAYICVERPSLALVARIRNRPNEDTIGTTLPIVDSMGGAALGDTAGLIT
jgi:peptidoglycan/LPS O-acetylase OafA/YrhL